MADAKLCAWHSDESRIVLCPFPDRGEEACHQCGAQLPALELPKAEDAWLRSVPRFCPGEVCSGRWNAAHPGYWNSVPADA